MASTEFPSQIISNIFEYTIKLTKYAYIYFDFNNSTENELKKDSELQYPAEEFGHSKVPNSQLVTRVYKLFDSNCLCWWITGIQRGKVSSKPNQCSRLKNLISTRLYNYLKQQEQNSNEKKSTPENPGKLKVNSLQKQALDDTAAILTSKALQFSKKEDYASSVKMLRRASELESPVASYDLGLAYFKGLGVERNIELAQSYFEKASILGHEKSKQITIFLRKRISLNNLIKK